MSKKFTDFNLTIIDIIISIYYVLYFLSYIYASNSDVAFTSVINEFPFILLYIFFRITFSKEKKSIIPPGTQLKFLILVIFIMSMWGLLQFFLEIDVTKSLKSLFKTHHFPVIASLGNPNFFAEFLTLSAPFTLSFLSKIRKYSLFTLLFIIQGTILFLTYSRLAWAVICIFMVLSLFFAMNHERKKTAIPFVILILICSSFFIFHYSNDSTRSMRILNSFSSKNGNLFTERGIIYGAGFKMYRDSSLIGSGPGAYGYNYLNYQSRVVSDLGKESRKYQYVDLNHAHSDFLEIGIDSGYTTQVIYILLILFSSWFGIKNLLKKDNDLYRYINIIPILYIPFGIWAFPFYLPFSKMILFCSIAYISGEIEPGKFKKFTLISKKSMKYISILFLLLILSFSYFHSRYIISVLHYNRGLSIFSSDPDNSLNQFQKGIHIYPYNGHNYLSAGSLLLNEYDYEGITFLKESLKYFTNSKTYLYLARGYRDFNLIDESIKWYKRLLEIRPDSNTARKEYNEILKIKRLKDNHEK